jgi:hypothetical protein
VPVGRACTRSRGRPVGLDPLTVRRRSRGWGPNGLAMIVRQRRTARGSGGVLDSSGRRPRTTAVPASCPRTCRHMGDRGFHRAPIRPRKSWSEGDLGSYKAGVGGSSPLSAHQTKALVRRAPAPRRHRRPGCRRRPAEANRKRTSPGCAGWPGSGCSSCACRCPAGASWRGDTVRCWGCPGEGARDGSVRVRRAWCCPAVAACRARGHRAGEPMVDSRVPAG